MRRLRLTNDDRKIVVPSPSSRSVYDEETREIGTHSSYWKSYQEQHAVGEEAMFDWHNLSKYIVERDLWSCRKADKCIAGNELTDTLSSGCYDDSHKGDC